MTMKPWLRLVFVCSLCKIGFFLVFIASIFFRWFPTPLWFIFKILHSCRYFCVWHSSLRFHLITLIRSVLHLIILAPWRNKQSWKIPRGNQNRQSEEETTQHNIQQKKAKEQTTIYETLHWKKKTDRATRTRTLLKIGCELKCSGIVWTQVLRKGWKLYVIVNYCCFTFTNIVFEDLCLCRCMYVFIIFIFRQNLNKYGSLKKCALQIWHRTNINVNIYFFTRQNQTSECLYICLLHELVSILLCLQYVHNNNTLMFHYFVLLALMAK